MNVDLLMIIASSFIRSVPSLNLSAKANLNALTISVLNGR